MSIFEHKRSQHSFRPFEKKYDHVHTENEDEDMEEILQVS